MEEIIDYSIQKLKEKNDIESLSTLKNIVQKAKIKATIKLVAEAIVGLSGYELADIFINNNVFKNITKEAMIIVMAYGALNIVNITMLNEKENEIKLSLKQ